MSGVRCQEKQTDNLKPDPWNLINLKAAIRNSQSSLCSMLHALYLPLLNVSCKIFLTNKPD